MDDSPFITLVAGGIPAAPSTLHSSSSSEDTFPRDSSPASSISIATHDTSRTKYHIDELSTFAARLEHAAASIFPNKGRSRYENVHVLLLRWEEDAMGVEYELDDLAKTFESTYGFETETWLIPSTRPHFTLMSKALQVVEEFGKADSLLIVYYAGHGLMNPSRQALWTCTSDVNYASVQWYAIQTLFEQADSDALLLFDCCAAASSAPTEGTSSSVTETIAACGFETWAPQPGRHSFTNTLIAVLDDWHDRTAFTAAMLHCEVLNRLRHEKPEKYRNTKKFEFRKSPIHIISTSDPKARSVGLCRRFPPTTFESSSLIENGESRGRGPTMSKIGLSEVDNTTQSGSLSDVQDPYSMTALNSVLSNGDMKLPHVLISLALEEEQLLDFEQCRRWLQDFPALAKFAKVEGVYRSNSTLILLSVPVMVWDWIPDDPACTFVGYVHSENLHQTQRTVRQENNHQFVDTPTADSLEDNDTKPPTARNSRYRVRWYWILAFVPLLFSLVISYIIFLHRPRISRSPDNLSTSQRPEVFASLENTPHTSPVSLLKSQCLNPTRPMKFLKYSEDMCFENFHELKGGPNDFWRFRLSASPPAENWPSSYNSFILRIGDSYPLDAWSYLDTPQSSKEAGSGLGIVVHHTTSTSGQHYQKVLVSTYSALLTPRKISLSPKQTSSTKFTLDNYHLDFLVGLYCFIFLAWITWTIWPNGKLTTYIVGDVVSILLYRISFEWLSTPRSTRMRYYLSSGLILHFSILGSILPPYTAVLFIHYMRDAELGPYVSPKLKFILIWITGWVLIEIIRKALASLTTKLVLFYFSAPQISSILTNDINYQSVTPPSTGQNIILHCHHLAHRIKNILVKAFGTAFVVKNNNKFKHEKLNTGLKSELALILAQYQTWPMNIFLEASQRTVISTLFLIWVQNLSLHLVHQTSLRLELFLIGVTFGAGSQIPLSMPMMPLYILAYLRGPNMVQYFIGGKEYLKVFSSGEKSIKALRKHVQRLTLKFIILLISTVQLLYLTDINNTRNATKYMAMEFIKGIRFWAEHWTLQGALHIMLITVGVIPWILIYKRIATTFPGSILIYTLGCYACLASLFPFLIQFSQPEKMTPSDNIKSSMSVVFILHFLIAEMRLEYRRKNLVNAWDLASQDADYIPHSARLQKQKEHDLSANVSVISRVSKNEEPLHPWML